MEGKIGEREGESPSLFCPGKRKASPRPSDEKGEGKGRRTWRVLSPAKGRSWPSAGRGEEKKIRRGRVPEWCSQGKRRGPRM